MKMTKKTEEKLVSMFNEVFEDMEKFDGKSNCAFYIQKNGSINLEFDEPLKSELIKLYNKICPSLWTKIKEAF